MTEMINLLSNYFSVHLLIDNLFSSTVYTRYIVSLIVAAYYFTPKWESLQWWRRRRGFGYTVHPTAESQGSGRWPSCTCCTSSSLLDAETRPWSWSSGRLEAVRSQKTRSRRHCRLWKRNKNCLLIPGSIQSLRSLQMLFQLKVWLSNSELVTLPDSSSWKYTVGLIVFALCRICDP